MPTTDCRGEWHDWLRLGNEDDIHVLRCSGCGELWVHHGTTYWFMPPFPSSTSAATFITEFVALNSPPIPNRVD